MGQLDGLGFLEAAAGDGRGADAHTGGDERGARVVGHRVLVDCDVGFAERCVSILTGQLAADQINQHQVVVGAAGDDLVAALDEGGSHRLGVFDDLGLIGLELGLQRLFEGNGLAGDDVHQRTTLTTREDGGVELLVELLVVSGGEDQATARTGQGLVGGGGDHVSVGNRVRVDAGGDEASHVGHVDEQVSTDLVGDFAHASPVDNARVSGEAADHHLRLVLNGQTFHLVVVDLAGLVDAVGDDVVQLAGEVDRGAVSQVTAVSQVHTQHGVTRLQQGHVDGAVGLGAGVRLHVGVGGTEQLFGALDSQGFNHIHILATTVVALGGVTFGVLVGQLGALGFHDAGAGVVLGRNQLDMLFLTTGLVCDGLPQLGIIAGNGHVTFQHPFLS